MKKTTQKFLCILAVVLTTGRITAQLSGPYSIPGSYASIAAAIADLNTSGVSGAVTINIAGGYTETAPAGGYSLGVIAGASAANTITFQKSGAGANPLISAYVGTATPTSGIQDGVWWLVGSDYVTIDGINITDPNTTNPASMEFGYGLYKASATNGCQNITIKNCVITLNRVNNAAGTGPSVEGSKGINVVNATAASNTVALTITAAAGSHSNNKFYSNTIQNCNVGIAIMGFADVTPFANADTGNDIGGSSSATGNTIINFGGGGTTSQAEAVITLAQYNFNVSYNTIRNNNGSGVDHAQTLKGIVVGAATSANASINNNTITLTSGGTTQALTGIENASGGTAAANAVNMNNNLITGCTYTGATNASFNALFSSGAVSAATVNINNNTFSNNSIGGNGSGGFIHNSGAATSVVNINNNVSINGFTFTGTNSSSFNFIYSNGAASTASININGNVIQGIGNASVSSTGYGLIVNNPGSFYQSISNNVFDNLNLNTTGGVTFINNNTAISTGGALNVNNNSILTGFTKAAGGTVALYLTTVSPATPAGVIKRYQNNNFSNITLSGATTMSGWVDIEGLLAEGPAKLFTNNTFTNWICGTSATSVITCNWAGGGTSISSNTISNFAGAGSFSIINFGPSNRGATATCSSNIISSIASNTTGGAVTGINVAATTATVFSLVNNTVTGLSSVGASAVIGIACATSSANISKNRIYNLLANNAGGTVNGLRVSAGTANISNNLIGDLRAPISTGSSPAIIGMNITGGAAMNVYFNSVYINATSTGVNFSSAALFANTTPSITLLNNIFANASTPMGTGVALAYLRSSTTISTYMAASNNNLFYAGVPSANNLVFYDGTNVIPTLAAFKVAMATRDGLSVSENPPFVSTVGSNPAFLTISASIGTQIESGGIPVSGITDDYAGTTRNVTTPDIGAFEGTYLPVPACAGTPVTSSLAGSSAAVCPSVAVNLVSLTSYSETGITYQWLASTTSSASGFTSVSNATVPVLTNTNLPATTWYQLQVTCSNGGLFSTSLPLQIILGPPALNALSNTTFVCTGQTANLSLSASAGGLTYQWLSSSTASNSGFSAITNATLATRSNTGIVGPNWFQAILSCSANTSYSNTTNPVSLLVGAVPTATASSSAAGTVCASSNVTLTAGTDVGAVFIWKGPSNYTSNVQNPVVSNGASGNYTLITSLNTCSSTAAVVSLTTTNRLFLNNPVATPSAVCLGGSTTLLATDYASAKVNGYGFTPTTGAPLITLTTGSVSVIGSNIDDTVMGSPANLGFTFNFNGVDYTQFTASPDGWIMLGGATGSDEFTNGVTSTANVPRIYPYWDDLATGTNGYVKTQLIGTAPTRTFVVEWYVTIPRATGGAANSTFQALLFEVNGNVEFRYGTMGVPTSGSISSGLTGDATNFNCITYTGTVNSTVTANNSNAVQPASGTSYLFTPPVLSYAWSPAANLSSTTGAIVTSTPATSTIYSVDVTYGSCVRTRTLSVNVTTPPVVNVVPSSASICPSASATLTANGATTYSWNTGSTNTVLVVSPSATLTTYTVVGTSGPCAVTKTISISIPGNPNVTIGGSSGICTGQTATLIANGASTYSWNTGATTNSITDAPSSNTTYTVIGTDALGCSTTTTQVVNVAASLAIAINGPTAICVGQTPTLTASGGVTYTWSTASTDATIAPTPLSNVTYSVIGASGTCSNTALFSMTVNPNPTVTVSGSTVICVGKSTTLTANGAQTYTWSPSTVSNSLLVSPIVNTTYSVSGTSSLGCPASATVAIVSNSLPVIGIAASASTICLLTSATFTASGANSYTWTAGPTNAVNTVTLSATSTVYTVNGTNAAGCVSSKTVALNSYSLPVLAITPSSLTICSTSTASFTASGASTYTWSGIAIPSATAAYAPASSTIYTVTGTSTQSCVASQTVAVVTNTLPVLAISPAATTVCAQSAASFTANGASTYTWNNIAAPSSATYIGIPASNTTYTVAGTNAQGCTSTAMVAVTTLSLPAVMITPSFVSVCYSTTSTYTASGAVTYTWSDTSNGTMLSLTPTLTSAYSVSGTGANGCIANSPLNIVVNGLPTIGVSPLTATVCPNAGATFTASGASTYTWSNGPLTTVAVISPPATGVYTVTGMDQNGCIGTKTLVVTTKTVPVIVISPASTSICIGATASFTAAGANSYTWSTNTNGSMVNVTPVLTTTYSVIGRNTIGCSTTATTQVNVWQLPVIAISPVSPTICAKEPVTFTATGAASYTWYPFNATTATLTSAPTNSAQYTVIGLDVNGCSNTNTVMVFVEKCLGIANNGSNSNVISVYPNPSTGFVTAKFEFEGQKNIVVMNSVGAVVAEMTSENESEVLNLSDIAKGVYFIKITSKGNSSNHKVIIE